MAAFSFKKTIIKGIALGAPLGIAVYIFLRFIKIFEKIIAPFAKKFEVETIFGELTLTVFAVFLLLVFAFILGLLMNLSFISNFRLYLEGWILKLIPSLNYLKLAAAEKLDLENAQVNWKPVLLFNGGKYSPAYIIDESDELIVLLNVKIPSNETGDVLITKKSSISYEKISLKEMQAFNKQYGKGYITMIEKNSKEK